jgi:hypothetical protein
MPNAIITAIMFVGNLVMTALPIIEVVFGISGTTFFVTGALAITAGVVGMSKLMEMSIPRPDSNYARQKTVRSTTAPVKRVYGESLISGPVAFMGVGGTGNQDLWHVIALTGDKSEAITDIYLDNVIIPNADINSGNALGGAVNGTTTIFKPIDSTTLVTVYKYIGAQTAVSQPVDDEFFKWTSDHKGRGLTYIATKFSFPDNEKIAEIWNKYNPQDIKALVKGMAIYDPRKDSTSPEYDSSLGVSTHRLADSTTWQWSDNPALCLANYVIDDQFGMGVPSSAIDWASVHSSADYSDALVSIPNSQTQKRFTCNGVLYGTDSHSQNINKILSSMNGSLVYSSGKYVMQAGQYIEPESDAILTDNDLNGPINITVANTRDDRFNTIKGTHFNPQDLHKKVAFPEVQLTDIATRDAGEVLYKEVELPMTNDVYMCQRLTYQMINRSNDQLLIEFPCNLKALRYTVGDRVKITLDKFAGSDQDSISFNQTPFVILGFNFSAEGAVTLTMLKDTEANYIDMPAGNYSQIASDGSITDGFSGVPAPTNLGSVVDGHFVRLTWDNPVPNTTFNDIIVYQSSTSNFSDSSIFLRTKNDAITFSLPSSALTKYYWVRASLYDNEVAATDIIIGQTYRIRNLGTTNWVTLGATAPVENGDTFLATSSGTSSSGTGIATDESAVSAVVGPETVTTTDQVADSVEWIDVDDSNLLRPANNATVGATLGTDVYDGQAQAYAVGDLLNSNGFFRFTRTSADDNVDAPANAAAFNTAFGRNPTDGDIVVVTNTTSSPNKQAAYQYDGSTFGTISGFFAGDLIIDDTITAAALSVDELGAITADLGTITGGTLKGGTVPDANAAPSGTESGSFFDLTQGRFVVGNATNNISFDGSGLSVVGGITATSGTFAGSVNVNSDGKMYGGTMSSFNTGTGFFLGYDTDAYKFSVGNASSKVLTWDGDNLNIQANLVSFTTAKEQVYSSLSRLPPGVVSAARSLGSNSDYFYFDSDIDVIQPSFVVSYKLGALTSGSISGQTNSRNAIVSTVKLELFYATASYSGTPGSWTSWRSRTFTSSTLGVGQPSMSDNTIVVRQFDLGGGNWETKLLTREEYREYQEDDYYSPSFTPNNAVDDEYYLNWRVGSSSPTVEWPVGAKFIKVVATITNGSYTPYPSTGSPSTTETRVVSIPGGTLYEHENYGSAIALGGQAWDNATRYIGLDGQTNISGGEIIIGAGIQNPAQVGDTATLKFVGFDEDGGSIRKLSAIEFHNGISTLSGTPDFQIYVPNAGDVLRFAGDVNFNSDVDVDGTLSINGVTVNAGAVTGPAGSNTQVQFNNNGALGASSGFTFNDSNDTLTVSNLTVSGTTTTVNTDNLTVKDPNITLNYSTGDSSSTANNSGITIQDAVNSTTDASILWKTASDTFEFSHNISAPNVLERVPGITTVSDYDSLAEGIIHTDTTNATNQPYANHNFTLTLINSSSDRRAQFFMADSDAGGYWVRNKQGSVIGWHPWAKILTSYDVTATATELNVLDGITATTTELNYTDGVTSAIQTQINNKLSLTGGALTGSTTITGAPSDTNGLLTVSNTHALGGVYYPSARFVNGLSNHSYGIVAEFRTNGVSGTDRPSILFTTALSSHTWQVGAGTSPSSVIDDFVIGYRGTGNDPDAFAVWSTPFLTLNHTTGNATFAGTISSGDITSNGNITIKGADGFNATGETASLYIGDTLSEIRATYGGGTKFFVNGTDRMELEGSTGNLNLKTGALEINGLSVITTGRALTNITSLLGVAGGIGINRDSTNGSIFFTGAVDDNHALWNAYYGNSATTRGAVGSGFDGIYWNAYRGIHLRGGLSGAYDLIKVENSSGSLNDHTVKLYAANVERLATATTGVNVSGTLNVGNGTAGAFIIGSSDNYALFKAHSNNNHMIGVRAIISGSTSSPTITGGHNTTFIEHLTPATSAYGWFFKDSYNGGAATYATVASITSVGIDTKIGGYLINGVPVISSSRAITGSSLTSSSKVQGTYFKATSSIPSETSANTAYLDYASGDTRILSKGPDGATLGGFRIIQQASDSSPSSAAFIIDTSSNATFAGTISSGAITTTGSIQIANTNAFQWFGTDATSGNNAAVGRALAANYHVTGAAAGDFTIRAGATKDLVFGTTNTANVTPVERFRISSGGAATFTGTISSGTITVSGEIYGTNGSSNLVIGNSAVGNIYLGGGNNNTSNIYLQTGPSVALTLNSSNNATFAGTISSGAISVGQASNSFSASFEALGTDAKVQVHYSSQSRGGIAAFSTQRIALYTTSSVDDLVFGYSSNATSASFVQKMKLDNGTGQLTISGPISSADHTIISGTSGTNTTGLLFKTTDNADVEKYIKQTAYYMQYNGNNNEGHHFTTANTNSLLRLHGATNGTRPNSVDITAANGLYMNNQQVMDSSRNLTNIVTANFSGKVDFQGDAAIIGGSGYGVFKGYGLNSNHMIISRGILSGTTASPTITGGHHCTFVEYCDSDSNGFYFKRSDIASSYGEIARITRIGITSSGNITAYSDERLKSNIKTLDGSKVLQMRGVSFTKDGREGSGVIAQELELIASELVHTSDDEMGTKSVAYGNLVGYLIENAKQQQSEIDELKALVKTLMEK